MLQKIPKNISQYIKSQQYIIDTYTIAKELIENSLDSGATAIKVILNDNCVIVEDNGKGIEDLNKVCKSGFTSKEDTTYKVLGINQQLTQFTHGFRGQALSSISELCDVEIISKCSQKIDLENDLKVDNSLCTKTLANFKNFSTGFQELRPREFGTTVKVFNLFKNCPIRKKADEKSIRKSVAKILVLMRGFAYVYETHLTLVFKNQIIFSEKGSSNTKEFAISKHGNVSLQVEDDKFSLYLFPFDKTKTEIILIEKRICRYEKAENIIKTVFKQYFEHSPCFILLLKDECDVNISADKSEVILKNCKYVENKIKSEMDRYFTLKMFIHGKLDKEVENEKRFKENRDLNVKQVLDDTCDMRNNSKRVMEDDTCDVKQVLDGTCDVRNNAKQVMEDDSCDMRNNGKQSIGANSCDVKQVLGANSCDARYDANINSIANDLCDVKNNSIIANDLSTADIIKAPFLNFGTPMSQISTSSACGCANEPFKLQYATVYNCIREETLGHSDIIFEKSDFKKIKIIGQFNQGFILGALERNDRTMLLVVDQHAADEIYNFEMLKKTFKLKKQKLLQPIDLELSGIQQLIVDDNLSVFTENGFDVVGTKLHSLPVYNGVQFTSKDFYSLLDNISNGSFISDRFRDIMASKACRSSIMIGTCLGIKEMQNILDNLSSLISPWNCPHGRPTFKILSEFKK